MSGTNRLVKVSRETLGEILAATWKEDRTPQQGAEDETALAVRRLLRHRHPLIVEEVFHCLKEHQPMQAEAEGDFLLIEEPENPQDAEEPFVVPPLAYLRAMLTMVWEAFRHPLSTSTIDLTTGRVIDRF